MLGLLGLIPLAGGAALYGWGPENLRGPALLTLLAYSAAVVSFLGGVRWGVEMGARAEPRWGVMTLATLPSIAAWLLLALPQFASTERQLGGFIAVFLLQWLWDGRAKTPPRWYPRLRTLLTLGAVASLAAALVATLIL